MQEVGAKYYKTISKGWQTSDKVAYSPNENDFFQKTKCVRNMKFAEKYDN